MPVVSRLVTDAEWRAIEHEHNLEPKSIRQLGSRRPLADRRRRRRPTDRPCSGSSRRFPGSSSCTASPARTGVRQRRCWGRSARPRVACRRAATRGRRRRRPRRGVGRRPRRHSCRRVEPRVRRRRVARRRRRRPTPGARFRGRNHTGIFRWGRVCEIVVGRALRARVANRAHHALSRQHRVGDPAPPGRRRHPDRADVHGGRAARSSSTSCTGSSSRPTVIGRRR